MESKHSCRGPQGLVPFSGPGCSRDCIQKLAGLQVGEQL